MDFKANELEIGIVEAPVWDAKKIDASENPPSQMGLFRTLTTEEIEERLQSIADKG